MAAIAALSLRPSNFDFLDDPVNGSVLAALIITAAVGIFGITGFFTYVPNCGSAGLAGLGNLLAVINYPVPFFPVLEP